MVSDPQPQRADVHLATCDSRSSGATCITCSDEALPAHVLRVDEATAMAIVEIEGQTAEVDVSLVETVLVGEVLLVHGGVALGRQ